MRSDKTVLTNFTTIQQTTNKRKFSPLSSLLHRTDNSEAKRYYSTYSKIHRYLVAEPKQELILLTPS